MNYLSVITISEQNPSGKFVNVIKNMPNDDLE